ncbi:MAG: type II secretion system protein [Deltaproteobacteria bacterium]|nr:type II secretion system protein [Deltaproteobacteria bacterium]MBW2151923.1 type II secretion system protein [Deltaproteobacteria bacterium]
MNRYKSNNGFTLIELIVVISLISIMFFFSIPRFANTLLTDNIKKTSRRIVGYVRALKENSLRDHKVYTLHVSFDTNTLWATNESMTEEMMLEAEKNGFRLPDDLKVLDVEFPWKGKVSVSRADIYFYPQGYSDKALIHMQGEEGRLITFLIEPFLSDVRIFNKYAGFDD